MANTHIRDREPVMAWVDKRDRQRLVELARAHERSLSGELRIAIAAHVQSLSSGEARRVSETMPAARRLR